MYLAFIDCDGIYFENCIFFVELILVVYKNFQEIIFEFTWIQLSTVWTISIYPQLFTFLVKLLACLDLIPNFLVSWFEGFKHQIIYYFYQYLFSRLGVLISGTKFIESVELFTAFFWLIFKFGSLFARFLILVSKLRLPIMYFLKMRRQKMHFSRIRVFF